MDELIRTLKELFNSTDIEVIEGCFQSSLLVDRAESLCCDQLITGHGDCNWENIKILRSSGYRVFPGEKDSFGWLTGCVQKIGDTRILVYG